MSDDVDHERETWEEVNEAPQTYAEIGLCWMEYLYYVLSFPTTGFDLL